jgi:hypothetical protein
VTLTSWDYMWRSTPLHRYEALETSAAEHLPPRLPDGVDAAEVLAPSAGAGPLFHRRYSTRIRATELAADELMSELKANLNRAAPTKFARFQKVLGENHAMAIGDEYVVRMPGPWDGPVRVVAADAGAFRLVTLSGHLESGQIEFRVRSGELITFEIESWARSSDRLSNLLYHHLRMAKEVQLHMWISFLEGVVSISGGRMTGGIEIDTRRVEAPLP